LVSPDGAYAATLKIKDCGAGCSPSASVMLHDLRNRLDEGDIEVFDGVGGWPIELHWADRRTMVVMFCDGKQFKVRSHFLEGEISDDGQLYPTLNVMVVNDAAMVVNGKAYCRFPEPPQN